MMPTPLRVLFIEEALLGAPMGRARRCVPEMRTLKYSADLRFDMESEGNAQEQPKAYDYLMQSASDPQEGQTQNSDRMD
jgi:hypothetical protein